LIGSEPHLCVAVATRDRSPLVVQALASVSGQLRDADELIVVDNGSRDGTREAVRKWLEVHCPAGRLVHEPAGGVSAARNAALRQTKAPIVCFLDDDERADPSWLQALRGAWAASNARVGMIGGPMRADWGAARPPWLADYLLYAVSVLDLGSERRRLDERAGECVWGGNMSLRVAAAEDVGGFAAELGHRPGVPYGRGEEEELQHRLVEAGWEIWYEPTAAIDHLIGPERLTHAYFRTSFRNQALRDAAAGRSRVRALRVLTRAAMRYIVLRLIRSPAAVTATFTWAYGWTLLTAKRPR
jgi:glycosyltransferase involved in cell wall biosynthesis